MIKDKQVIYIDGNHFGTMKAFGREIKSVLCISEDVNLTSLDAINDVLYGGFGTPNYLEEYEIVWRNFKKSELKLNTPDLEIVIDLFESNPFITLRLE